MKTIVRKHRRMKSVVKAHSRRVKSKRGMGWVKKGPGKEVFLLENAKDYDEMMDLLYNRIAGLPQEEVEETWHEMEMMAHPIGSEGRKAWEEVMRKKYGKEYPVPKFITRNADFLVNPAIVEAKNEPVKKTSFEAATVIKHKKR